LAIDGRLAYNSINPLFTKWLSWQVNYSDFVFSEFDVQDGDVLCLEIWQVANATPAATSLTWTYQFDYGWPTTASRDQTPTTSNVTARGGNTFFYFADNAGLYADTGAPAPNPLQTATGGTTLTLTNASAFASGIHLNFDNPVNAGTPTTGGIANQMEVTGASQNGANGVDLAMTAVPTPPKLNTAKATPTGVQLIFDNPASSGVAPLMALPSITPASHVWDAGQPNRHRS